MNNNHIVGVFYIFIDFRLFDKFDNLWLGALALILKVRTKFTFLELLQFYCYEIKLSLNSK